jgi:hypothetical protein
MNMVGLALYALISQACPDRRQFISEIGYYDCIQSRTDLNAWLRKQEVKGPPDVMFGKSL